MQVRVDENPTAAVLSGPAAVQAVSYAPQAPAGPEELRARRDLRQFAGICLQLTLLLVVCYVYKVHSGAFLYTMAYAVGVFVVHYFTPVRLKKSVFVCGSLVAGALIVAHPFPEVSPSRYHYVGAFGTVGVGALILALVVFLIMRSRVAYGLRVTGLLGIAGVLTLARAEIGEFSVMPDAYWGVIGSLFMFRLILYAHEVRFAKKPESLGDTLSYFLLLPNYCFLLFPVVDYATFKKSYLSDDIHRTAQRGVAWMTRGVVQLLVYRFLYHRVVVGEADVNSFVTLLRYLFTPYLLYTNISGQFHIIVGMLHLFGYKLPETNRRYLLADSFTDFWRRINIYWKDFMVKVFYYPAYFRLRKKNETLAISVATAVVFVATTVLHGWQWFWIQGSFKVSQADLVFWTALGVLVWITVLREMRRGASRSGRAEGWTAGRVLRVLGVYVTISLLWSIWSSESIADWLDTITYWSA